MGSDWSKRVAEVFRLSPRDASDPANLLWLTRRDKEKNAEDVLKFPGRHLCIDGPTGTGKTSLCLTTLGKLKKRYVVVQVTRHLSWKGFCRLLVKPPPQETETKFSAGLEGGVQTALPFGKFQVSLDRIKREGRSVEEIARHWDEHDVCAEMVSQGTSLMIDDFEKANVTLVERVADMAKLLTQSYFSEEIKLVIVGTDDIYSRLYKADPSLEARITQLSLGAFEHVSDSWAYLQRGWNKLKLLSPANTKYVDEKEKFDLCERAVYQAADGLPKTLSELGWKITGTYNPHRKAVRANDIIKISDEYLRDKVKGYRRRFPNFMKELRSSNSLRAILRYFLEMGIGNIHSWSELVKHFEGEIDEPILEDAIQHLIDLGHLTQTGHNGDILFFRDLSFGHTIGIVAKNPLRFGLSPNEFEPLSQLSLPFPEK